MQLARKVRSEHDVFADKVFAALETGNTAQARTLMQEYREHHTDEANRLQAAITKGYGVRL